MNSMFSNASASTFTAEHVSSVAPLPPTAKYEPATRILPGRRCSCGAAIKPDGKTCAGKHAAGKHWEAGEGHVIHTGHASKCFVLDADSEEAVSWVRAKEVPRTYTVKTGRGTHFYFASPSFPVKTGSKEIHPEIDIRGEGGLIVAAGSPHADGGTYRVIDLGSDDGIYLAPAPAWLLEQPALKHKIRDVKEAIDAPAYTEDENVRIARAKEWFAEQPPCVEGMPGGAHKHAFVTLSQGARYHGVTSAGGLVEASRDWNVRAVNKHGDPWPWSGDELAHKINEALHRSEIRWCDDPPEQERFCAALRAANNERVQREKETGAFRDVEIKATPNGIETRRNIVMSTELLRVVKEACEVLAEDGILYQRHGKLIEPVLVADREIPNMPSGTPTLREVRKATLRARLTGVAKWWREEPTADGGTKRVPTIPSDAIVDAVSESSSWPGVSPLHGIVEAPMMRANGSILQTKSYDPSTAVLYYPSTTFPPVPDAPTHEDAKLALAALREVFDEFPCASEADRMVPVAAILTSLAMGALDGANFPAFVFDANVRGAGKTLACDAVSWVLHGRNVPKQTFPASGEELEKILASVARAATPLLCLDNVNAPLGGDALEGRITCGGASMFRILGQSKTEQLPWRTIVLATGNNIAMTGDMCRRVLRCRLVSLEENPETRKIEKHPDLQEWVLAERARLVVAGLTVLRAYVVAGRPNIGIAPMGNFDRWRLLIAGAIKWASGVDVLDARVLGDAGFDASTEAYAALLAVLPLDRDHKLAEILAIPAAREAISIYLDPERADKRQIAGWLRKRNEQPIGGRQLIVSKDSHRKQNTYRVRAL